MNKLDLYVATWINLKIMVSEENKCAKFVWNDAFYEKS